MKEKKFTEIYNSLNKMLRRMAFNATGDWMVSEEICQQAFMRYFENMDHVADDIIKPWIILTTKNLIRDYYRKMKVRKNVHSIEQIDELTVEQVDNTEQIIRSLANRQLTTRIMQELYAYNKSWYDVIESVCIFEMSHEEARKHLGISDETLRSRLFRVRRYIRKMYGEEYEDL